MRHTYECPLRWADMDLLGHVNNVRYLAYVTEARAQLLDGLPAARARVRRHRIAFVAPLVFRRAPVRVDSWLVAAADDTLTLAHEVYDETPDGRTTYLRATTELDHRASAAELELLGEHRDDDHAWSPVADGPGETRGRFEAAPRRSDLDAAGLVGDVAQVELVQESRIHYFMDLHTRGERWSHHVVARTDLDYLEPVPDRSEPYAVHSWVGHLGGRSFTIVSELRDGDRVLTRASVVMVVFDMETQRPTDMTPEQRDRLARELPAQDAGDRPADG